MNTIERCARRAWEMEDWRRAGADNLESPERMVWDDLTPNEQALQVVQFTNAVRALIEAADADANDFDANFMDASTARDWLRDQLGESDE